MILICCENTVSGLGMLFKGSVVAIAEMISWLVISKIKMIEQLV